MDFGTGGLTMGAYQPSTNKMLGFGHADYEHLGGLADPGWREQNPMDWIDAIPIAREDLGSKVDLDEHEVEAIAIGGHMHAACFLDKDDMPIMEDSSPLVGAIMWDDPRGEEEAEALADLLNEPIAARQTISRVRWLAKHHSEMWSELVKRVTVPSSFVGLKLTGEFGVGIGDGSGFGGQPDDGVQFSDAKLRAVDPLLAGRTPKVGVAGEMLGRLNAAGAELLNLKEGIPVAYPEGDQPIGMVASGVVKYGGASISLGNSVVFNVDAEHPVLNHRGLIDAFYTAARHNLLMTCVRSGCSAYDIVVNMFKQFHSGSLESLRTKLGELAAEVPAGCDGMTALPWFIGEGVFQLPKAGAVFSGIEDKQCTAGHFVRAVLEASTFTMRAGMSHMGIDGLDQIVVSGGGSQDKIWPQIIADVFNVNVVKPQDAHEAATRGAAYLGLHMLRRLQGEDVSLADVVGERVQFSEPTTPIAENVSTYDDVYAEWRKAVDSARPLYRT